MRSTLIILSLLCTTAAMSQSEADRALTNLMDEFEKQYYSFDIPSVTLDFKVNLRNELQTRRPNEQRAFFSKLQSKLEQIDPEQLNPDLQLDFEIISFETSLNQERLHLLEKSGAYRTMQKLESIYQFTNGAEWYAWFIKKWTGTTMSPAEVMAFGQKEVARVKDKIDQLDLAGPKPPSDFTRDVELIRRTLKNKMKLISTQLPRLFPDQPTLPALDVQQGTNPAMAQAPGYYSSNTFYFNLFDTPFDLADCDWLLIHEGNPGHHFQVNFHNDFRVKDYRAGLRYMGFVEGWAAYTENLGWEMGLYQKPHEALGKWKWDIIRSVRIVLDVGLNYYGWTDEKALTYWQQHISNQDDIARREIARMKRWPAQVLTYKMGEAALLKALKEEKSQKGDSFSYKDFHTRILGNGTIPVALIPKLAHKPL